MHGHSGQPSYDQEPAAALILFKRNVCQSMPVNKAQATKTLVNDVAVKVPRLSQSNKKEFKLYVENASLKIA